MSGALTDVQQARLAQTRRTAIQRALHAEESRVAADERVPFLFGYFFFLFIDPV